MVHRQQDHYLAHWGNGLCRAEGHCPDSGERILMQLFFSLMVLSLICHCQQFDGAEGSHADVTGPPNVTCCGRTFQRLPWYFSPFVLGCIHRVELDHLWDPSRLFVLPSLGDAVVPLSSQPGALLPTMYADNSFIHVLPFNVDMYAALGPIGPEAETCMHTHIRSPGAFQPGALFPDAPWCLAGQDNCSSQGPLGITLAWTGGATVQAAAIKEWSVPIEGASGFAPVSGKQTSISCTCAEERVSPDSRRQRLCGCI
eukprot:scaffold171173_cov20-Tisochrysis_lutea.AAC.1